MFYVLFVPLVPFHVILFQYILPYSLDIMPPLFISLLLLRYIFLQFTPLSASAIPMIERKVRTHRNTLNMKSIATYWPVIHRPSDLPRGGRLVSSWWWCENFVFSDRSHSASSLIIS